MDIESLAVSTVINLLSVTDYLVPYIPTKDRGPSFDGCVVVYSQKGNNHAKTEMMGRVDVQVKGKIRSPLEIKLENYSLEVSDLRNFLVAGGALLLVVSFDSNGKNEQVYYSRLLPFELKRILKKCSENQKYKNVPLDILPSDSEEIVDLFMNFVGNYNLQRAYVDSTFEPNLSLLNGDSFGKLSVGFVSVQQDSHKSSEFPLNYFLTHGTYIYADVGYNIRLPVEYIEKIDVFFREETGSVEANDTLFYNKYKRVKSADRDELLIGESHKLIWTPSKKTLEYKYMLNGTLKQQIKDEEFFLNVLKGKGLTINGHICHLDVREGKEIPSIEAIDKHVEWMKKAIETLELLNVNTDLLNSALTPKDVENLNVLIDGILMKKQLKLSIQDSSVGFMPIGKTKVLLCALKRNDTGKFDLFSYYDAPVVFKGIGADKKEFDSTYYVMLSQNEMINSVNIDLPRIIKRIKSVSVSKGYISHVNLFMLEVIKVYDATSNNEYFTVAEDLCNWLMNIDRSCDSTYHRINYFQIQKRKRKLSAEEQKEISGILTKTTDPTMVIACNILLEKYNLAKNEFERLKDDAKVTFLEFPISHLHPDLKDS